MSFIGNLLLLALDIYFYIIVVSVIISWLIAFEVINAKNEKAQNLIRLLERATEPVYSRLRKFLPVIGGIDLSPMVVIIGIFVAKDIVIRLF